MKIFIYIVFALAVIGLATNDGGCITPPSQSINLNSNAQKSNVMEIWKDVKGYEGLYLVSNYGRVRSRDRIVSCGKGNRIADGRILSQGTASNGYFTVSLWKNGVGSTKTVHSLVAESFLGHISDGFRFVINHKDTNKKNNRLDNLEIITNRENTSKKHINASSKYTGVSWVANRNKWRARIKVNGINESLGSFNNEYDAHIAYENRLSELKK